MPATPRSSASRTGSCRSVRAPAVAASWAIPAPIVPAPTTPTVSGSLLTGGTVHSRSVDPFTAIITGGLAVFVVALLLIGRYSPRSGADVLDWKPTRSPEVEAAERARRRRPDARGANQMRRRRGLPERTEEDVSADTERHRRELERADARWRAEPVARVLIVGCGCRGQALARELRAAGHAVRGTTRDPARADGDRGGGRRAVRRRPRPDRHADGRAGRA